MLDSVSMDNSLKADAVFEGGGVKGIGLVGAIAETEARGFRFENVAGTSAGAIVAALVAAGYTAAELKVEMESLDYRRFQDKDFLDKIPTLHVRTTDFSISAEDRNALYESGKKAAQEFFEGWSFDRYKEKYRRTALEGRRKRV
jgi:predicted acylesterase/phospholipase RssA